MAMIPNDRPMNYTAAPELDNRSCTVTRSACALLAKHFCACFCNFGARLNLMSTSTALCKLPLNYTSNDIFSWRNAKYAIRKLNIAGFLVPD
jgi:hypothetical protein